MNPQPITRRESRRFLPYLLALQHPPGRLLQRAAIALLFLAVLPAPLAAVDFAAVTDKARTLAASPYQAPPAVPKFLRELDYSQYQDIRFDPEQSLWREAASNFQVMLVPPGCSTATQ